MSRLTTNDKTNLGRAYYDSITDYDIRDSLYADFIQYNKPKIKVSEVNFYFWVYTTKVHDYSSDIRLLEGYLSDIQNSTFLNIFIVGDILTGHTASYKERGLTRTTTLFADTFNENRSNEFLEKMIEKYNNPRFKVYRYHDWYNSRLVHLKSLMKDRK